MSRIGKIPVPIPSGVTVTVEGSSVKVKGPKGELVHALDGGVTAKVDAGKVVLSRAGDEPSDRARHGLHRALIKGKVDGVANGFEKKLSLVGVGYRAQAAGDKINLSLGFSHPVVHTMPKGVTVQTPVQTEIIVKGIDKQQVGQVAAEIRAYRPPEPYKGKGVRYIGERVKLKETKKK